MTAERWLPIPEWEGIYEVSDLGRIRRIVTQQRNPDGYLQVSLRGNGRTQLAAVHRLVMLAFEGPRPEGMEVRHLNGKRDDARKENLRYGTKEENRADRERHRREREQENGQNLRKKILKQLKQEKQISQTEFLPDDAGFFSVAFEPAPAARGAVVTISEALAEGVLTGSLASLRTARHRDPSFPKPVASRRLAYVYDLEELRLWQATR